VGTVASCRITENTSNSIVFDAIDNPSWRINNTSIVISTEKWKIDVAEGERLEVIIYHPKVQGKTVGINANRDRITFTAINGLEDLTGKIVVLQQRNAADDPIGTPVERTITGNTTSRIDFDSIESGWSIPGSTISASVVELCHEDFNGKAVTLDGLTSVVFPSIPYLGANALNGLTLRLQQMTYSPANGYANVGGDPIDLVITGSNTTSINFAAINAGWRVANSVVVASVVDYSNDCFKTKSVTIDAGLTQISFARVAGLGNNTLVGRTMRLQQQLNGRNSGEYISRRISANTDTTISFPLIAPSWRIAGTTVVASLLNEFPEVRKNSAWMIRVDMTDAEGTPGVGWDLLNIQAGDLELDSSELTRQKRFTVREERVTIRFPISM
jgi:hypothetical protein